MPKFMFIFRGGGYAGGAPLSPTELQAHLGRWDAWTRGLHTAGKLVEGHPLEHPASGSVVRGRDKVITDGPYAESKDLITGALIVEVATLAEATEIARGCPILEDNTGSVEVRPLGHVPNK
jgi:hypothetical protein